MYIRSEATFCRNWFGGELSIWHIVNGVFYLDPN